ncbi:MAG: hypothetical protein ACK58T_22955, partial [Phycisphaerae bacterium]
MLMRLTGIVFLSLVAVQNTAFAGLCGVPSYNCCPTAACAPASCYTTCRVVQETCYRSVCETVYEPEQYKVMRTVYE